MQRAVHDFGWRALWPVQLEAIAAVLGTDDHVLVSGDTASGKTEGVMLPILTVLDAQEHDGFSTLVVSPLRALLNDQHRRLEDLAGRAGIAVHLWHSDVSRSRKAATRQRPSGILLTTPESLEAMCIHRSGELSAFFRPLRFVIVDELHAFLGTSRGAQLGSLLRRLLRYSLSPPRRIGLSATIGDPAPAVAFLRAGAAEGRSVVTCSGPGPNRTTYLSLRYVPPSALNADIFALTRGKRSLIFCNARATVETLCYDLNRRGLPDTYLPHHGSLHHHERAFAEASLRATSDGSPRSLVCTSTLELGIDVGAVDVVVQVDCTHSVLSLRQRLGRSGRAPGQPRMGRIYATGETHLLQALAIVQLLARGWVEPAEDVGPFYDVLWQQTLSAAIEQGGLDAAALEGLPPALLPHMVAEDHLELGPNGRLFAGLRGEHLAHRRDFCAVFSGEESYEVVAGTRILGRLPLLPIYRVGTPLILAAHLWTITEVDRKARRLTVTPGATADPPVFTAQSLRVHPRVRRAVVEVLTTDCPYPYLDSAGAAALATLRSAYAAIGLTLTDRPVVVFEDRTEWHAFAGDRVAATLALMVQRATGQRPEVTALGGLVLPGPFPDLLRALPACGETEPSLEALGQLLMELVPDHALRLPKFGAHLPPELRREVHRLRELDVPGAIAHLREHRCPLVRA